MAKIFLLKDYVKQVKCELEKRKLDKFLDCEDIQGTFTLAELEALLVVKDLKNFHYEWVTTLASLSLVESFLSDNKEYYKVLPRYGISSADADSFVRDFYVRENELLELGEIDPTSASIVVKHCKGMPALLAVCAFLYKELLSKGAIVPSVEVDFGLEKYSRVRYSKPVSPFVLFTLRAKKRIINIGFRSRRTIF